MRTAESTESNADAGCGRRSTAENTGELVLEPERRDRGRIQVVAKLNGKPVYAHTFDPISATARKRYCKELSERIPSATIDEIDAQLIRLALQFPPANSEPTENKSCNPEALLAEMPAEVCAAAIDLLAHPLLIQQVVDDIAVVGVAGEKELTATVYLIGTSRKLNRPLSGRIHGPSSSGKTIVIEGTAQLFPPESVIRATQMTPQALFHMRPGALEHCFVVAGERSRIEDGERAEATRALREMISSGRLSKLMPVKGEGGRIETVLIEQPGPIAYIESTTLSTILDEDANRCVTMHTDEQSSQTRRIIRSIAKTHVGTMDEVVKHRIIQKHHALQRMLRYLPVHIPFAERLGEMIPDDRVEARRAFSQIMSMIEVVVLLYQKQRITNANDCLIATAQDYQIARHLLGKPMSLLLGGVLSEPARRFLQRLEKGAPGPFTTTEILKTEKHCSAVHGWLTELRNKGYAEVIEKNRGRRPAIWQLTGKESEDGTVLPTCEMIFGK